MLIIFSCLLISIATIDVCVTACDVCLNQIILTSPIACPLCKLNGRRENTEDVLNEDSPEAYTRNRDCASQSIKCNNTQKYRTIDGSCNNLRHPGWGKSFTMLTRILPPHYSKNQDLSVSKNGHLLPKSRLLSTCLFKKDKHSDGVSLAVMLWGQFVSHDMTFSMPAEHKRSLNCCGRDRSKYRHKCMPIDISKNDNFYSEYCQTCLNQTRAKLFNFHGKRTEQASSVTHYIDASHIYGSSIEESHSLREFKGGKMSTQSLRDGRAFLPKLPHQKAKEQCFIKSPNEPCYLAGDERANQHPQLSTLQLLFVREHNRIVKILQIVHPQWDDETLYQEGRAIVIAELQHITYRKWLVHFIGKAAMKKYKLYPRKRGYTKYNDSINPMSINSFTSASYRSAHSSIPDFFKMFGYDHVASKKENITTWLNRPCLIQENNNFDEILIGMANQRMRYIGPYKRYQIQNLMFHGNKPYGNDLYSIDIERGRDHGLAPYVSYLEVCTNHKIHSFDDLQQYIPKKHITKLKKLYESVEDIDLFIGGILENKVSGSRFGPTFLCIIIEQFYRKKWGDRFWYEVGGQPHSFSKDQLQEIRKASLSRIICDNSDAISRIRSNNFLRASSRNPVIKCDRIDKMDLSKWK